ncbi:polyhydroxyalkanoate synthesis repressor PhaR [Colwellia sp. MB02u-18]|nr:polyhydroxyalkanoate synthesis repressor PhaR [Colwellia sp. MB3u-45]MBA6266670.1 polyhydroxyalkanoate synthesis repressor PhaR [Colwellia sp. MB3u-43]MBA6287612.1 polyhydroxyalkanoate synthesis repressor PhaR [Colwellia sp. MB3u-4]MBA6295843.1 polyhydroxyalkanoate synthesis repressor PhaR [Colwellia sp. MB02u-9]MBA6320603.1 polyhydroxyalkanoate synthesis repressor PhaR [Colwellia sp. MB02u-19]MBA6323856.1 polyhydroxyalkanoate synthesis repressor PhaR [Colwellia sp. MB02u-18]MBA6329724.1 p
MITIKRYPNRRLYDTTKSHYVNLDYIRELVISNQEFKIVDSKTSEDKTRSILVQIISEEETSERQSLLTNTLLKRLICFYGNDNQDYLQQFLEQSLAAFIEHQDDILKLSNDINKNSPFGLFSSIVEQNMNIWTKFQKPTDKQ